jgi:PAS domain S-box-containing protein
LSNHQLAEYFSQHKNQIINSWLKSVEEHIPAADNSSEPVILNHLPALIDRLISNISHPPQHPAIKSQVEKLAQEHGRLRATSTSYNIEQVIREYRILRTILQKELLKARLPEFTSIQFLIDEFIDISVEVAACEFSRLHQELQEASLQKAYSAFQAAEGSQSLLKTIVDELPVGFVLIEAPSGKIKIGNDEIARIFRHPVYPADGVEDYRPWKGFHADGKPYRPHEWPVARSLMNGEVIRGEEIPIELGDGSLGHISVNSTPIRDNQGSITAAMATVVDISEHQKVLHRLMEEQELRERFVATLTHDLRTPLTAAKISAQLLMRRPDDPGFLQKSAARIAENIDRVDQMIRDLLDANLISAGEKLPLELTACNLAELARDTIEELSTLHGDHFILNSDHEIQGYWSCSGLRRILENLCNNAVKYGDPHAPVTVGLSNSGGKVKISVHNEGSPIPQQDQATLFTQYHRSDSALKGGQKGWGLGLTLVKGLAEAHGGVVSLISEAGQGTTFTVELPLDARK